MIIDFTVKNFRSIRDVQLFSMNVQTPKTHLTDNIAFPGQGKFGVLKTAGVYGANAAGKSNLLLAFLALQWIADDSADLREGRRIPCYEPYKLCHKNSKLPVVFELEFFAKNNVRYLYSVSYDSHRVISESLDYYPSRQAANIFRRGPDDDWKTIYFGGNYKGGTRRIPFFDNNSYLAKAGSTAGTPDIVKDAYNYIRNILSIRINSNYYHSGLFESDKFLSGISSFLGSIDTGIVGISRQERKNFDANVPDDLPPEVREAVIARNKYVFSFSHKSEEGEVVSLGESKESDGTRKLFGILPLIFEAFYEGSVVVMDELENSLHPHVARLIVRLFNDPDVNKNNAQLIYSTHNMNLMSPELLRRDQVWFVEKVEGASHIYSLDEFDKTAVKASSPYADWYDEGRFGALPEIEYCNIVSSLHNMILDRESSD